jgi:hypothetical protein
MNSLQSANFDDPNNEGSNDFSSTSFLHEFVHRQSVMKPSNSGPILTIQQKLKNLHN